MSITFDGKFIDDLTIADVETNDRMRPVLAMQNALNRSMTQAKEANNQAKINLLENLNKRLHFFHDAKVCSILMPNAPAAAKNYTQMLDNIKPLFPNSQFASHDEFVRTTEQLDKNPTANHYDRPLLPDFSTHFDDAIEQGRLGNINYFIRDIGIGSNWHNHYCAYIVPDPDTKLASNLRIDTTIADKTGEEAYDGWTAESIYGDIVPNGGWTYSELYDNIHPILGYDFAHPGDEGTTLADVRESVENVADVISDMPEANQIMIDADFADERRAMNLVPVVDYTPSTFNFDGEVKKEPLPIDTLHNYLDTLIELRNAMQGETKIKLVDPQRMATEATQATLDEKKNGGDDYVF